MEVAQEVSNATSEQAFDAPVISPREAAKQVTVRDGQTTVLGGLLDHQRENTRGGVPFLSDLPILGGLFGGQSRRTTETEMFLFLTPRVLRTDADVGAATDSVSAGAGVTWRCRSPGRGHDRVPAGVDRGQRLILHRPAAEVPGLADRLRLGVLSSFHLPCRRAYIVAMLRAGETWRVFERGDEKAVYGGLGYAEALERFERLWRHAREVNPELGSDWLEDLAADFAIARAVNGLPPAD